MIQLSSLSSSSRHQLGLTAFLRAASQGHVDTVELLLDSGSDIEEKNNVSRRICSAIYMHIYIKRSMSWTNIARRILLIWDETRSQMIVDRWWGWCMDSMWFHHSIFHSYLEISYEMKWHFSLVSFYESYNFLDCNLLFVICICISHLTLIFV